MPWFITNSSQKEFQTHIQTVIITQHIHYFNSEFLFLLYTLSREGTRTYCIEKNFCHCFITFESILELLQQVNSGTDPDTMKYEQKQIA